MSSTAIPRSTGTPAGPRLAPGQGPAASPTATTTPTRFYHNTEVPRLSRALSVVANLLKSPTKVSSRLFDIGKAIVLLALSQRFSPNSMKVRQLEQSSGADRSRGAINTISTWARQVSKQRANKDQSVLELLNNAARAAPATKQTLLERFGMGGTNPASVCKELSILLTALAKELRGEAGRDSPSPSCPSATEGRELSGKGGTATVAVAPSADPATAVAAVTTKDIAPHRKLPASTDSAVAGTDTAVQASLDGVKAKPVIAIVATTTTDESKGGFPASAATAIAAEVGATAGDVIGPGTASSSSHKEENTNRVAAIPGMVVPPSLETGTPAPGVKSVSAATTDMGASHPGGRSSSSSRRSSALQVGKGEGGWGGGRGGGHLVKEGQVMGTKDGQSSMLVVHGKAKGSSMVRQGSNRQKTTIATAARPNAQAIANAAARERSRGLAFIARPANTPFSSGPGQRGVPRGGQVKAVTANRAQGGVRGVGPRKQGCELSRPDRDGSVATATAAATAAAETAGAATDNVAKEKRDDNDGVDDDKNAGGNHRNRKRPVVKQQPPRPVDRPLRERSQQDAPNMNASAELRRTKGLLSRAQSDRDRLAAALVQQQKLRQEDIERHAAELIEMRKENLVLDGQRSRLEELLLQAYRDMAELQGQKFETESRKDDESKSTSVPSGCPRPEDSGNNSGGGGGGGGDDDHPHEPSTHISAGLPYLVSPGSYAGSDTSDGSGEEGTRCNDVHDPDGHDRVDEFCPNTASTCPSLDSGSCSGSDTTDGSEAGSTHDDDNDDEGNDDGGDGEDSRDGKLPTGVSTGCPSFDDGSEERSNHDDDDDDDDDDSDGGKLSTGVFSGCPSLASDVSYDGSLTYGNDAGGNPGDDLVEAALTCSLPPLPPPPSQQKQKKRSPPPPPPPPPQQRKQQPPPPPSQQKQQQQQQQQQRGAIGLECKGVRPALTWRAEELVTCDRREILDRFNGVGFLASLLPLSDSEGGSGGAGGDGAGVVAAEKGAMLGEGGGGGVFDLKIVDERLQGRFAGAGLGQGLVLKTLKKPKKGKRDTGMREIRMLASFMPTCHPNITNVFATNIATRSIVMEKMGLDLEHLLNHPREDLDRVSQDQMVRLICGAALGLTFMHEMGFAHGDVKPANMLVSNDLRECKISDFGGTGRPGVAYVGDVTLPFTPPEAMGVAKNLKVPLEASMDVWSMGMVVLQATSRARYLPTDHEVLASHIHHIYPNERQPWIAQASEANLIAIINFDIACEQSKRKQIKAASDMIRLREVYFGTLAKTKKLDDFILSRRAWPEQRAFQHLPQVRKVLGAMLAVDPRERINMRTVGTCLKYPGLWARTTTGLQAAASADAPGLAAASPAAAASPSPGDGGGKTSSGVTTLPDCIHRLLSVVDDAASHDMDFTADGQVVPSDRAGAPSWLEVEMAKKDGAWWQNVPIPEPLVRKGPRPRFMV